MKSTRLSIYQGDDYTAVANVTQNGAPISLSGFTAPAAQLRRGVADNDATVDATFVCTISGSTVILSLARAVTVGLNGCYQWDLEIIDPTGHLVTLARGPAHITQEVTRP